MDPVTTYPLDVSRPDGGHLATDACGSGLEIQSGLS